MNHRVLESGVCLLLGTIMTLALANGAHQDSPADSPQPDLTSVEPLPPSGLDDLLYVTLDPGMFLGSWSHIDAEVIKPSQVGVSREAILRAMSKYPECVIRDHVERVYLANRIRMSGTDIGGTYNRKRIYLACPSHQTSQLSERVEAGLHHELSSILRNYHKPSFPESQWRSVNPSSFSYLGSGLQAVRANMSGRRVRSLMDVGFVCEYGQATLENDFNTIASDLFMNRPGFWSGVDECPQLAQKVDLAIKFYSNIDPVFTERYFRDLPAVGEPVLNDDVAATQPANDNADEAAPAPLLGLYSNDEITVMSRKQLQAAIMAVASARRDEPTDSPRATRLKREFELILGRLRVFARLNGN